MKILNPNTPLSNFIYTIIDEKNKQIKENILLGQINFPKFIFYSKRKEDNVFKADSHISFINGLNRQKQLIDVREEKSTLEKKVNIVDNQLLYIKNNNNVVPNIILNYNEKYMNTNLNDIKINPNSSNDSKINNSKTISKNRNKSNKSFISDKKSKIENIKSFPTLSKERNKEKKIQNIALKPIQIKSYKSNSKINNHETEEKLVKNAKAFIQKINNNKKNILSLINKKQKKLNSKLKNEIEKIEMEKKIKYDEYNKNNNNNIYGKAYNNMEYYNNYNNINDFSNLDNYYKKEDNKYSPNNSKINNNNNNNKSNILNKKKYFHYSPYGYKNSTMLKNLSKDLLNFNSELYYNNNMPNIIQYQSLFAPLYANQNMINRNVEGSVSTNLIYMDEINNTKNNNEINIVDATNGEINSNISRINNYSIRNDDTIGENNNIDYSFNKRHLYYFNEPKYKIEITNGENEIDKIKNSDI
jgi:hypothetical protein